ncbi:unnamed protein product [Enterobius vermicularis]|uniref:Transmembrane 9 superfamily member n=1 Tax=Enterobius vermicularis TaxID=51028 RepID=A0A0N4V0K1_ENTVE|nr:unnamed protein product [Enterobius vermicularis]
MLGRDDTLIMNWKTGNEPVVGYENLSSFCSKYSGSLLMYKDDGDFELVTEGIYEHHGLNVLPIKFIRWKFPNVDDYFIRRRINGNERSDASFAIPNCVVEKYFDEMGGNPPYSTFIRKTAAKAKAIVLEETCEEVDHMEIVLPMMTPFVRPKDRLFTLILILSALATQGLF